MSKGATHAAWKAANPDKVNAARKRERAKPRKPQTGASQRRRALAESTQIQREIAAMRARLRKQPAGQLWVAWFQSPTQQ